MSCIGGKEQYAAKDSIRILTEVLASTHLASMNRLLLQLRTSQSLVCSQVCTGTRCAQQQYRLKCCVLQYYERLKGSAEPAAPDTSSKPADISNAIADEVAELQSPKGQLFVYHRVNVFGLIYIGFHTPDVHPTPSEVVQAAAQDVLKTKQCLSK